MRFDKDEIKINIAWMLLGVIFTAGLTIGTIKVTLKTVCEDIHTITRAIKKTEIMCYENRGRIIAIEATLDMKHNKKPKEAKVEE